MPSTTPFWLDEPYEPRAALAGDLHCDVAIVGGGVGGLSTAWHLQERGVRAVLLEGGTVAGGASGRNGGFLVAGPAPFYNDARRLFGPELARRIQAATAAARGRVLELADELGAADAFRVVGTLRLASADDELEHVRELAAALSEDGFEAELWQDDELPPDLRRATGLACFTPGDAAMQPARWIRALARGAEARGVRIFEGSPVRGPVEPGQPLETPGGTVFADRVVVAADGALAALVPSYAGRVRCRRLHMIATEPLGDAYRVQQLVSSRWGYEYFQRRPDGRLTLGGLSDLDGPGSYTDRLEASPAVHDALERYLRERLGLSAAVTHRWVGLVGYSRDQRPFAGELPGSDGRLFVAGGYTGSGNLNGFVAGRIVAELIADGSSPDSDLYDSARSAEPAQAAAYL